MANPIRITESGNRLQVIMDDRSQFTATPTAGGLWIVTRTEGQGGNPDPDPDPNPNPSGFIWPFPPSDILRPRGEWMGYPGHKGVDIPKPEGTPIIAAQSGVVERTYADPNSTGWGNYIRISHGVFGGYNIRTGYAHLRDFPLFSVGQQVQKGEVIGYVGNTGRSQGPHLHFEVYQGGSGYDDTRVNPEPWMAANA